MKVDIFNTENKYKIIYADPAWLYRDKAVAGGRGAGCHYTVTRLEDIKALPVEKLADDDSVLFMWVTMPFLEEAFDVMRSWGFEYKTVAFVWDKQRTNYGFYTLSQCELCLAFKKGRIPKRAVTNVRQFLSEKLGKHSEKPAKIRERIDTMYGHLPRIELFARQQADGWDCWGNEVEEK